MADPLDNCDEPASPGRAVFAKANKSELWVAAGAAAVLPLLDRFAGLDDVTKRYVFWLAVTYIVCRTGHKAVLEVARIITEVRAQVPELKGLALRYQERARQADAANAKLAEADKKLAAWNAYADAVEARREATRP